jgi:predicted nucleic acid-binding protein
MNAFILDCSISASWFFSDEADEYSRSILESLSRRKALVPSIWPLEMVNVLLSSERRGRLSTANSRHFLDMILSLPIDRDTYTSPSLEVSLYHLGLQYELSSYDAAYLELALRHGLPLATKDKKLLAACEKTGIPPA